MSGLANFGENLALNLLLGSATKPGTVYIALCLTEPSDTDTGSTIDEPSGGGYARVAVANNATQWPNASGGVKSNGNDVVFPEATANWGTVRYFAILNAASGGSLIAYGKLVTGRSVKTGNTPRFAAGSLSLTAD